MADCPDKNPLQRAGTSQGDRLIAARKPEYARIHEWQMEDWLKFAYDFAKSINFFDLKDDRIPAGDWTYFFETFKNDDAINQWLVRLGNIDQKNDLDPHLALFIAFLWLINRSQDHINQFTQRHLDFYYHQVLQLNRKEPVSDQVHVIFELAKNAGSEVISPGTQLNGGKDNQGKLRYYATDEELVVNNATLTKLHTILHQPKTGVGTLPAGLYYAEKSNTADGLEVEPEDGQWAPFGHKDLPAPDIGFSVASPLLQLREGERWIHFSFQFIAGSSLNTPISKEDLINHLEIYFTGEKGWLGPFQVFNGDSIPQIDDAEDAIKLTDSQISGSGMNLLVRLSNNVDPIVAFNTGVFEERIPTTYPVARIQVKFPTPRDESDGKAYEIFNQWRQIKIEKAHVDVLVKGMQELVVENDQGPVDASKPFFPFGPQPSVGSNLFIGKPEVFDKNWRHINIAVDWKNLPVDLAEHYTAYREDYLGNLSKANYDLTIDNVGTASTGGEELVTDNAFFKSTISILSDKKWVSLKKDFGSIDDTSLNLFKPTAGEKSQKFLIKPGGSSVENGVASSSGGGGSGGAFYIGTPGGGYYLGIDTYSQSIIQGYYTGGAKPVFDEGMFAPPGGEGPEAPASPGFDAGKKKGFIKLTLDTTFFHKEYPGLYAVAVAKQADASKTIIPNAPYTPEIAKITMDYFATSRTGDPLEGQPFIFYGGDTQKTALTSFQTDQLQFFHEGPFGFARQHFFLKDQTKPGPNEKNIEFPEVVDNTISVLPDFFKVGQFILGVENISSGQTMAILFQVSEGSENPLLETFDEEAGDVIEWQVLSSNEWMKLNKQYIFKDTSNNFLKSGIVKFLIPKRATQSNTWLPSGYVWLRAVIQRHPDRVCKFLKVIPQAVEATFQNNNNDLAHLQNALEAGTITKLIDRPAKIKKVNQPFSSFGGNPRETQPSFYRRVSVRLRHKQRAVSIWDYEHLVLEAFPVLYKAKCLNHTRFDDSGTEHKIIELAPGNVSVVVVPDLHKKNAFDPLQPRVSQNILIEIQDFLLPLFSPQVTLRVINPLYEEVKFQIKVVFHYGFDPILYTEKLNQDLITYLSPWVKDPGAEINFGGIVHKSQVISYVDGLHYIDYITDFNMKLDDMVVDEGLIRAGNSAAILVSAEAHVIDYEIPEAC